MQEFITVTKELGSKRGPLLVQLPPSFQLNLELLDDFLSELKETVGGGRWRIVVEFRHTDWICDRAYKLLDDHGVALCITDLPRCPVTEPNNARFVYIRRSGPGGRYGGCYSNKHIADDGERISRWLEQGRDVYVYYNNDIEGHAIDNAKQLIEFLSA